MVSLLQLLRFASTQNASDIHLAQGSQPGLRIDGKIVRIKGNVLGKEDTRKLCYSVLNDYQKSHFEENKELDFSFEVKGVARFRANYYFQKGAVSGIFRKVPHIVPSYRQIGIPKQFADLVSLPAGLILVTGPTGSGKSTTIASMIDRINNEQQGHIISLEDPIEFFHEHKSCIVTQREIGSDTTSFKKALKYVLRQDPDYCLVGELRDLETVEACLTLAETGHLVFGTLHTSSAVQTIARIVNVFPSDQQDRVRGLLSFVLQGIFSQRLLPKQTKGRALSYEYLRLTPSIRNLIREDKMHQVEGMMQIGQETTGMQTMNQCLVNLVMSKTVTLEVALGSSNDPVQLGAMLKKVGVL